MTLKATVPKRLLVSMDEETYKKLRQKAEEEGRSMSNFIYSVLRVHFGDDYKINTPTQPTTKRLNLRRQSKLKKRGA
jgi:hypothetical protein